VPEGRKSLSDPLSPRVFTKGSHPSSSPLSLIILHPTSVAFNLQGPFSQLRTGSSKAMRVLSASGSTRHMDARSGSTTPLSGAGAAAAAAGPGSAAEAAGRQGGRTVHFQEQPVNSWSAMTHPATTAGGGSARHSRNSSMQLSQQLYLLSDDRDSGYSNRGSMDAWGGGAGGSHATSLAVSRQSSFGSVSALPMPPSAGLGGEAPGSPLGFRRLDSSGSGLQLPMPPVRAIPSSPRVNSPGSEVAGSVFKRAAAAEWGSPLSGGGAWGTLDPLSGESQETTPRYPPAAAGSASSTAAGSPISGAPQSPSRLGGPTTFTAPMPFSRLSVQTRPEQLTETQQPYSPSSSSATQQAGPSPSVFMVRRTRTGNMGTLVEAEDGQEDGSGGGAGPESRRRTSDQGSSPPGRGGSSALPPAIRPSSAAAAPFAPMGLPPTSRRRGSAAAAGAEGGPGPS
jgi:hypothetical protein